MQYFLTLLILFRNGEKPLNVNSYLIQLYKYFLLTINVRAFSEHTSGMFNKMLPQKFSSEWT